MIVTFLFAFTVGCVVAMSFVWILEQCRGQA